MADASGDPHLIGKTLVGEEDYQAPPRVEETETEVDDGTDRPPEEQERRPPVDIKPVDINLLESQQQPGVSEPIPVAPNEKREIVVSGPDEEMQPGGPLAAPPGESM